MGYWASFQQSGHLLVQKLQEFTFWSLGTENASLPAMKNKNYGELVKNSGRLFVIKNIELRL